MPTVLQGVYRNGKIELAEPLAAQEGEEVLVSLLSTDISEREWLRAAMKNPAFDFLRAPEEDIYSLDDGKPFHDQG